MRSSSDSRYAAGRLSPIRRVADLRRLRDEQFDVLVVGGGVTGAGAALDAASRGLKVALVEARDLAAGTSSRSSKLIHGGLRYLEQLELHLVHEALTERGLLTSRLAPHLVRPVPILVPLPTASRRSPGSGSGPTTGSGSPRTTPSPACSAAGGACRCTGTSAGTAPGGCSRACAPTRSSGAIRYYDGQVDDARLVVNLARTAASLGAAVVTSARVTGFVREAREVIGVKVRDLESPDSPEFEVRARTVVAATGVWSDDMSQMLSDVGVRPGLRVRASKGVHLVVPRSAITGEAGLILRTATSVLFVIPWGGHWIIGTTDTDWQLDRSHPAASARDISYLLDQVNTVLDRPLTTRRHRGRLRRAAAAALR